MATHMKHECRMQVGLVAGADLPLPPPEPFQHQEHTQLIAQHQHQQLSQPLLILASEGEILQRRQAQKEKALQPLPSRLSMGLPTRTPREVSVEIPTDSRPTEGRLAPTPTTTGYAVDIVTETSLTATDTAGYDYGRTTDHGQDDFGYHGGEEGHLTASHLIGRFRVLHSKGRLEEAAATMQQALGLMEESKRRKEARRKITPLHDIALPGGSSIVHAEGKAPYDGIKDTKGGQPDEAGDRGRSENGNISRSSTELECEVAAGDRLLESVTDASAIADVMNDLGCTLAQVKRGVKNRLKFVMANSEYCALVICCFKSVFSIR